VGATELEISINLMEKLEKLDGVMLAVISTLFLDDSDMQQLTAVERNTLSVTAQWSMTD